MGIKELKVRSNVAVNTDRNHRDKTHRQGVMQHQDYCHYSQTKAHRADPGQSTQSPMRVPRKYRVQLGFLGALGNPVQTAQVSVTVASAQVQMQLLKLVVRG
jgi:hypothetical protein